ncbi:MAG: hypothetical protein M3O91_06420 [Chloroflexota bacterium]|nr:hypothetical protein [Chloroflexota bacterium]
MTRIPAFVMAVALGNLLVPLNSTMIVVALPLIARDLAVDRTASAWLVTSYLIAMASLQPVDRGRHASLAANARDEADAAPPATVEA